MAGSVRADAGTPHHPGYRELRGRSPSAARGAVRSADGTGQRSVPVSGEWRVDARVVRCAGRGEARVDIPQQRKTQRVRGI
ncbi:hypothetical protein GCM10010361_05610 [Streptomyces olivaceiscleroticus]|uniref:Transposase n=1 Tax=Streptomyces olivaceiscleroticus TaxID=68245 RepID=A0ABN0ZDY6_9ACTN